MKIIVDAFGGDNAPKAVIEGSAMAVLKYAVEIVLVGNEDIIKNTAKENNISLNGMTIVNTDSVMSMEDDPGMIIKEKRDSSMGLGLSMLAKDEGDAFVTAGSTGALVFGASTIVKRIKGIKRASLAAIIPCEGKKGYYILLDSGANVDCRPQMLQQFAVMGSIYMQNIMKIDNPRVCLLNNGAEETKGRELEHETYSLLKDNTPVNFTGNIEARQVPLGDADVVITDGFTGNILLKTTEGMGKFIALNLNSIFKASFLTKMGAVFTMKGIKNLKKKMDYSETGGAPLLGTKKPVIKAHGSSNAKAFMNAIRQAKDFAENRVIDQINESLSQIVGEKDE